VTGISSFERQRISDLQLKRERRKAGVDVTSQSHNCTICGRGCASAIGLYSHMRTHKHLLLICQLDGRFQQLKLKPQMHVNQSSVGLAVFRVAAV